jgi:8-oxo-dGTP pyrophosphatase MutT (NUDIX family)
VPTLSDRLAPLLLTPEQASALDVHGRTDAAVLVPLFQAGDELHAVFTRRRDDLRRHAGEISFPGGRQDPGEDLRDTALREAEEEIGLDRAGVELVGALAPTPTVVTSYAIYPFVGVIQPGQSWKPSAAEVAEVLELSLPALRDGYARKRLTRRGLPFRTDVYETDGALIWGATARILGDLFERLEPILRR